ncbi:MAG: cytochrome c-type biogenesis protein CcmH [Deferribacteres bacterium]|nr:cytochrome c-type biogenesis protein CcmH [candidate division KSB1 bacterium]MCB9510744.1 cytochrome c-type biogenesis protein CcmH [Deferribacteres bacterium]
MKKYFSRTVTILAIAILPQLSLAQDFIPSVEFERAIPGDSMSVEAFQRAGKLSNMLMAPCCYSKTAAEDQSGQAYSVKMEVRRGILEGYSDDQILAGFSRVYGERILAQPKATGFNHMAWIMPIVALIIGAAVYVGFIRKTSGKAPAAAKTATKKSPQKAVNSSDEAYLRRIERELEDYES